MRPGLNNKRPTTERMVWQMIEYQYPNNRSSIFPPILAIGFATALATVAAWFLTHMPMVAMTERAARTVVLAVWLVTLTLLVRASGTGRPLITGLGAGIAAALVGVTLIGGTMRRPVVAEAAPVPVTEIAAATTNSTSQVVLGWLAMGVLFGAIAGFAAWRGGRAEVSVSNEPKPWLARFAFVTALAVAPLLFVGGLVTSTDSGMAVPDWPTTFGSNMLDYPIGKGSPADVFLEHSHRLFGMLVGLASMTLMIWVLVAGVRGWARVVAIVAFLLVVGQGLIGAYRVLHDSRVLAMVHGVLAQLVFGLIVALAIYLSPGYASRAGLAEVEPPKARRMKALSTALLHTLVIQLIFGAMARHFRNTDHAMWTHAAFSVIVVLLAAMVGFAASALPATLSRGVMALRRAGSALVVVVTLQFLLGWAAFLVRGKTIQAASTHEALVRTAHQVNGALLIALAACMFVWARWLWRARRADAAAPLPSGKPAGA